MINAQKYVGLLVLLSHFAGTAIAADRGHSIKISSKSSGIMALSGDQPSHRVLPTLNQSIKPGQILDYSLYRQAKVISRDDNSGLISLDINGSIIRILPGSREVIDITG